MAHLLAVLRHWHPSTRHSAWISPSALQPYRSSHSCCVCCPLHPGIEDLVGQCGALNLAPIDDTATFKRLYKHALDSEWQTSSWVAASACTA
jgi:hypothetical protein